MTDIAYQAILPEGWPRPRGFAHAVVASGTRSVRIAGQLGKQPGEAHVAEGLDLGAQWRLAMGNLVAVLKAAGGEPQHVVMLRAYVTDMAAFNRSGAAVGEAWGATLGRHFPAMTLVQVSGLVDPHAMVEIEGEAILP
ncbi:RidA family protein [Chelatococcus reniformis]|uniref:Enamine deaminase RidA n=1 Tax=Chelatococcus reniformis TaxID=1494448 RepID=A0A916U937_9HYPH|nr:RidA family protein [Chelatococcus reniformis]GGC64014.1 enamine deaminase RidA [Chelatococcus reniformis]